LIRDSLNHRQRPAGRCEFRPGVVGLILNRRFSISMRSSSMMVGTLLVAFGMAGCGGSGGIEAGVPTDAPKGVAPVFETKPISPKDLKKAQGTGPAAPTAGKS
jgi:hypothetical protein